MDEFIIKKYKKLYLKAGKAYLFDVPALVEAMEKRKQVSTASISEALELVADDEAGKDRMANMSNEIDEKKFFEAVEVFCKEFPEEKRNSNETK